MRRRGVLSIKDLICCGADFSQRSAINPDWVAVRMPTPDDVALLNEVTVISASGPFRVSPVCGAAGLERTVVSQGIALRGWFQTFALLFLNG